MAKKKDTTSIKKMVLLIATVLAIGVNFVAPPTGLTPVALRFLSIFFWWIVMMVVSLIPTHMSTLAALVLCVITGVCTPVEAFSSFGSSTAWLLVGSFGLAAGLSSSGLITRIAYNIMKLFPGTYKGQILGMTAASLLVGPCIPSTSARCALLVPLAHTVADEMGFKPHSKGATGLFSVINIVTNFGCVLFLTGTMLAPNILAISGVSVTWLEWLKFFWLWGAIAIVLTVVFILFYYNPKKDGEEGSLDKAVLNQKCADLGKLTKKEYVALAVLLVTIILWITEGKLHSIPTFAVALGAWLIFSATGLFAPQDFSTKIIWPVFTMVGGILGTITLMATTGAGGWLAQLVAPVVTAFSGKTFLLVMILTVVATCSQFALINAMILSTVFVALLGASGISPLIIAFVVFMGGQVFVLEYQQITVISAVGVSMGMVEHKDIVPSAWAYVIINLIATAVSLPWWSMLGLI